MRLFRALLLVCMCWAAGAVDGGRHAFAVRQWLKVSAADGYTAVLALDELSPEFGNKPAILALQMVAGMLDAPRLMVPGDGRSVQDVVGLSVESLPEPLR